MKMRDQKGPMGIAQIASTIPEPEKEKGIARIEMRIMMNIKFGKPNPGQRIIIFVKFMDIMHDRVNQGVLISADRYSTRNRSKKTWGQDQINWDY